MHLYFGSDSTRSTNRRRLETSHSTQIASSIATDSHYDQVAFFTGETGQEFVTAGVFDFDGAVFADLWQSRSRGDFEAYVRYHLSDHCPL